MRKITTLYQHIQISKTLKQKNETKTENQNHIFFKMKICFTYFCFMVVIFLETAFTIIQIALLKMRAEMNGMSLRKKGMHFIHININSLLPKNWWSALYCKYNQCVYYWNKWD